MSMDKLNVSTVGATQQFLMKGDDEMKTFDFDDTLCLNIEGFVANEAIVAAAKQGPFAIVSSRAPSLRNMREVINFCEHHGLEPVNVFLVGTDEAKVEQVLQLNSECHFDDNDQVINELQERWQQAELVPVDDEIFRAKFAM